MKLYRLTEKNIKYIVNSFLLTENKIKHFIFASEFSLYNDFLRKWKKVEKGNPNRTLTVVGGYSSVGGGDNIMCIGGGIVSQVITPNSPT